MKNDLAPFVLENDSPTGRINDPNLSSYFECHIDGDVPPSQASDFGTENVVDSETNTLVKARRFGLKWSREVHRVFIQTK